MIFTAASTAVGAVKEVTGFVSGLLGSDDRDPARMAEAKSLADAALGGNDAALLKLRCLSGDDTVRAEACRTGAHPDACGGKCGYATKEAQAYARGLVVQVMAQRGAQEVAHTVTQDVIRPALNSAGYEIVPKPDLSTILLIGAAVVGGYLLLKKAF